MNGRFLLDVNVLVALLWDAHQANPVTRRWYAGESPTVLGCVFTELSFLRVSMADKAIGATFVEAQQALEDFIASLGKRYFFIEQLPGVSILKTQKVMGQRQISDLYLGELAARHHARLATLDAGIKHPAAVLVH